jgi:hypothetical protein
MMTIWRSVISGIAAGAAGTTALNAVTYLDMAIRGRPTSSTPQRTVEKLASVAGLEIPGDDDTRRNRLDGLGPLSGIATGVGVGAAAGLARRLGVRTSAPIAGVATGLAAMSATDSSMASVGVTDPRTWSASDWISDALPHLAYGLVTAAVLDRMQRR